MKDDEIMWWLRAWAPDLGAGFVVLCAGFVEMVLHGWWGLTLPQAGITLAMAIAVTCARHQPAVALGTVWTLGLLQASAGTDVMLIQFAIMYVAFATARWGSLGTLWASIASVPAGVFGALVYMVLGGRVVGALDRLPGGPTVSLAGNAMGISWPVMAGAFVLTILLVPWLVGLALRLSERANDSQASLVVAEADAARAQRESEQAREIAALREEQARLASDVHDVVGHSLAVILAQAESAQFLDDDPVVLKQTMVTIATSARTSLQDIRQVLAGPQQAGAVASPGSLEELIEGVRAGGHEVQVLEIGQSRPLPPELEVVAHRVVQEMLTNAIKHGRRDRPVSVERHWPEGAWGQDLRIEVRNVAGQQSNGQGGQGLEGMRRRLEAVGGKLDVRAREDVDGQTFTVTAWIPVSGR